MSIIASLSTAAVRGCAGRFRLSTRWSCRTRYSDKRNALWMGSQHLDVHVACVPPSNAWWN